MVGIVGHINGILAGGYANTLIQQRLEGYSTAEIAERQGTTDSAIYKRMAKVMKKLRNINEKLNEP